MHKLPITQQIAFGINLIFVANIVELSSFYLLICWLCVRLCEYNSSLIEFILVFLGSFLLVAVRI